MSSLSHRFLGRALNWARIVLVGMVATAITVTAITPALAAPPRQDSAPQTQPTRVAYTQPSRMNVRSGPGTTFSVVATLPANTQVEIVSENADGTWVEARIAGQESTVWLAKWLITETGSAPTAVAAAPAAVEATPAAVNTGSVTAITRPSRMNVRSGPGTNYGVVASVAAGTQAKVLGLAASDQWLQVELSGQSNPVWIFKDLTTVQGSLADLPRVTGGDVPQPAARVAAPAPSAVTSAPLPTGGGTFGYGLQSHMIQTGQEGTVMEQDA